MRLTTQSIKPTSRTAQRTEAKFREASLSRHGKQQSHQTQEMNNFQFHRYQVHYYLWHDTSYSHYLVF